ncbi:MAG: STAS domain-containing protein [bacterium]
MKLREEIIEGVQIVRIDEPRLDATISTALKTELLRLVEQEGAVHLLVDLKNVEYVDSSGLGALLFGHRQIRINDGKMKLVHLNVKVQTLIRIAHLDNVLESFDSEEEALRSF